MVIPDSATLGIATVAAMREVAETYILPRYRKLAEGDVRSKTHPGDLVTVADVESEHALNRMLPALLPDSCVIGEEAASVDAAVLEHLAGDQPVWIVDPVDGTANFVNGRPTFAVMIALVHRGATLMGWIHDPVAHRTLWAEKGRGAWVQDKNGVASRVYIPQPESRALSSMAAGLYNRDMAGLKGRFARIVRLGSAAHDYWSLTDGRIHVLCFNRMKPWDHAAGVLIHLEAGGYNSLMTGEAYSPAAKDPVGILCAPSREIWDTLIAENNKARLK